MKTALFAVALAIGGTAFAQTTESSTTTTTTTAAPAAATQVAPSNQTPERDARGIPVVSDPATAPAGANQPAAAGAGQYVPAPNQQQVFTPQAASEEYPTCSRTVTDNCVQGYERGAGRPR